MTLVIIGLVTLGLLYLFAVTVVPRWWAQRIENVVDGRIAMGIIVGVIVGIVFTVLPLLVLLAGWRMRDGWRRAAWFLVGAALLAAPNLATLGIVLGTGSAAHAGQRKLDVGGTGFRLGSLIGVIVGVLVVVWISWLARSRRVNKARARGYRDELHRRAEPEG